jgi:acetolactate decarboxylase
MKLKNSKVFYTTLLILISVLAFTQETQVKYSGKMSKIGQEKRVDAAIMVDSIKGQHLYAIGPVENLLGEILVWDSKPFVAAITEDKKPYLQKNVKSLKAIFLVYADISQWDTILLSDKISSLTDLEKTITKAAYRHGTDTTTAFPFLIFGKVKEGSGHIMYKNSSVKEITPATLKDANHKNSFSNQYAQMLGFYSQQHQTIFTHHDSFLHIHYRMANKYQAGHLDIASFDETEPVKLLLPRK